jgi:lipopolysaccharide export system permease protein
MTIFDRYVARQFIRVAFVCFSGMAGLYCVFDAFNNMDEIAELGKKLGGIPLVLMDYYGPRIPWFFDRTSALIALIGAMFAINTLQRTNELTAVMAAGITTGRVIRPIIIAVVLMALLAAANREFVLPQIRDRLVRNAQDWLGQNAQPVQPTTDNRSEILFNGKAVYVGQNRIEQPSFQLYERHGEFGRYLQAANAYYHVAEQGRPAGYLLDGVSDPKEPSALESVAVDGVPVILTPRDHPWLQPNQLFVASDISFSQLAGGNAWRRYASTLELIQELRNPSLDYGLDTRVTVHSRLVQPFLDMTLFFLGIPLVLTRENRNIFVAVGWCCLIVFVFFLVVVTSQALGNSGHMITPSLAAWLPLIIFVPIAAVVSQSLWSGK